MELKKRWDDGKKEKRMQVHLISKQEEIQTI